MKLVLSDCLIAMKDMSDNSVDAIITDPPYGISFMGKKWDYDVPSVEMWIECLRVLKPGGHVLSFGGTRTYHRMVVNIEDAGFEIRDQIQWIFGSGLPKSHNLKDEWQGYGTALKPANEPICLARKPLEKGLTISENVLKYRTGVMNIDGSRIEGRERTNYGLKNATRNNSNTFGVDGTSADFDSSKGRWPANIILDEAVADVLGIYSRFFYVAKASKLEKGYNNNHPTVKPMKLMEYIIKLITPPAGIILDPFMGSGSTGVAAKNLGFEFIGIEMNEDYYKIAEGRLR